MVDHVVCFCMKYLTSSAVNLSIRLVETKDRRKESYGLKTHFPWKTNCGPYSENLSFQNEKKSDGKSLFYHQNTNIPLVTILFYFLNIYLKNINNLFNLFYLFWILNIFLFLFLIYENIFSYIFFLSLFLLWYLSHFTIMYFFLNFLSLFFHFLFYQTTTNHLIFYSFSFLSHSFLITFFPFTFFSKPNKALISWNMYTWTLLNFFQ